MKRRAFLTALAGGGVAVTAGGLFLVFRERTAQASKLFSPEEASWLTVLIPVDVALAAIEPKLDEERVEFYRAALLHLRRLRPGFPGEPALEQARFVKGLLESDEFVLQFLTQLAHDASEVYYATDRGRAAVGYAGPPQPRGFPGYQGRP